MLCVCSAFESYQGVCLKVRFVDRVFQFFRSLCFISWICSVLKEVFRTFPLHFLLMSFFCIFFLKLCVCVCVCVCVCDRSTSWDPSSYVSGVWWIAVGHWCCAGKQVCRACPSRFTGTLVLFTALQPHWSPLSCLWCNEFHWFRPLICVQSFSKHLSFWR